jgi:hypothetical protein
MITFTDPSASNFRAFRLGIRASSTRRSPNWALP